MMIRTIMRCQDPGERERVSGKLTGCSIYTNAEEFSEHLRLADVLHAQRVEWRIYHREV